MSAVKMDFLLDELRSIFNNLGMNFVERTSRSSGLFHSSVYLHCPFIYLRCLEFFFITRWFSGH